METFVLDNDIKLMYVNATSFPEGVLEAHQKLHGLVPFEEGVERRFFGLSRPEHGPIVYKAAAEEMNKGEAEKLKLDALTLKKGEYMCITIHDYMKDIQSIGAAFRTLIARPDIDPEGYCVEWYLNNKDIKCMVRLNK